ncbi:hypothetical protein HanIR_Chr02g0055631 [Helianthus annuus]|nr:hypothetical protein HanIR_Chr02g0055631 [Helianthus annuus]
MNLWWWSATGQIRRDSLNVVVIWMDEKEEGGLMGFYEKIILFF